MTSTFKWFWDLTDAEITRGLDLIYDLTLQKSLPNDPMQMFVYDKTLQKMAFLWIECERDRTLMKIKFADEIACLDRYYEQVLQHPGQLRIVIDINYDAIININRNNEEGG